MVLRRAILTILALAVALAAGCAGQQDYVRARRYFELEQYDEAIRAAQAAVEKEPVNREYREFLQQVRETAALAEYNRGLFLYGRGQLSQAIDAFERATHYDSDLEEAQQAFLSVRQRRDMIADIVSDIPALLADGKPDEALNRIIEIQGYAHEFPRIRELKTRALEQSTILHTSRGMRALEEGRYDDARTKFQIALNRTPGYSPAVDGLSRANARIRAQALFEQGRRLMNEGRYSQAYDRFTEALGVVPEHEGAVEALKEVADVWARALYEQGLELERAGGFDNQAEALRRYERAGALGAVIPDMEERVEALKAALAPQFRLRGEQYEELGRDYTGLALINYQMSLYCDPGQVELARRVAQIKEEYDRRRAFYIDIRAEQDASAHVSFARLLAQILRRTVIESGIRDLYVVAPFDAAGMASALAEQRGLAGRHLTIFTSLLSEPVTIRGEGSPDVVRSTYRVGTRYVPNPDYRAIRRELAEARGEDNIYRQEYERLLVEFRRATEPDERERIVDELEFLRGTLEATEDEIIEIERRLARTDPEIEQEVFAPYDYLVYTVTMEARVEVSLEVADPYTGATKTLEVISGRSSAEDTYTEGVHAEDSEGVEHDPRRLPTESELLEKAREDAAQKAVEWLESTLTELAMQYYNRARELDEMGNVEAAAEYYYAFYLSVPDKTTPEAREALDYVRNQTHLIVPEEKTPLGI